MPTLIQLEYLVAVDKYRHFGKAARACHVSQPTLSQQLQKLEDAIGIILFDRIQKPVVPTPEGTRVIEQAKVVLREQARLLYLGKDTAEGLVGEFRLGIIPTISSDLVPLFVDQFSRAYPKVDLYIEELKTSSILEALEQDRLDAGILATPLPAQNFKVHPLYYESFVLYLANEHPLLDKSELTAADLAGMELWMLTDGHCFRDQVLNFCTRSPKEYGVLKNIHFQSGSLDTLKNLVAQSRGYTLLPALMTRRLSVAERKRHVRPFKKPIPSREVSLIYRRDHWKLAMIGAIEKAIAQCLPPEVGKTQQADQRILEIS